MLRSCLVRYRQFDEGPFCSECADEETTRMSVKDVKDAAPAIAVTTEPELGAVEPFVIRSINKGELVHVARDNIYFTVYIDQ